MGSAKSKRRVGRFWLSVAGLFLAVVPVQPQDFGPATDYEWELETPGRTMFRNRRLIGSVPLAPGRGLKMPLGKSKARAREALALYSDVTFVPGDTVRYFGVTLELTGKREVLALAVLDPDELAPFRSALRYLLKTAENIRHSERTDTQIFFRGKSDWQILFRQQGTQQQIEIHFPATASYTEQQRELQASQVSALADLIDLAILDLRRQGALVPEVP